MWWVDRFVISSFLLVNSPLPCSVESFHSIHHSFYETVVRPVQKSLANFGIHDRTYLFDGSFLPLYFVLDVVDFVFVFWRDSTFLKQQVWWVENIVNITSCMWTHLFIACILPSLLSIFIVLCFGLCVVQQLRAFLWVSLTVFGTQTLQTFHHAILESAVSERSLLKGCTFSGQRTFMWSRNRLELCAVMCSYDWYRHPFLQTKYSPHGVTLLCAYERPGWGHVVKAGSPSRDEYSCVSILLTCVSNICTRWGLVLDCHWRRGTTGIGCCCHIL